jgi:uracil-DNA glycosylase family 4
LGKTPESLRQKVRNSLGFFDEIGVEFVSRDSKKAAARDSGQAPEVPVPEEKLRPRTAVRDAALLDSIAREILVCQKCPLARNRAHAVPGEGKIDLGLMFVGEGPGAEENIQGRPFVGRAGQLLTKIIEAMHFSRQEVFITNIVKCQPPGNRAPLHDEIDACAPYLLRQLEVIQPAVIVALGGVSASTFVPGDMKISSLRGTFYEFRGIKVMPTFHPSYLVRNEGNRKLKKDVWDDMQKVMALLAKK